MKTQQIEGQFILTAPDGEWQFNEHDELVCENSHTVYFESSVGEGKAKYWTKNIEEAFIFEDIESAISMRDQTNRKYSPVSILKVVDKN